MQRIDLSSILEDQKTLVIQCVECNVTCDESKTPLLFRYTSQALALHNGDSRFTQNIHHYIEEKKCRHIILLGHLNCKAIQSILHSKMSDPKRRALKTALCKIIRDNHIRIALPPSRERILVEMNLLKHAHELMQISFVQKKVESKSLSVSGFVYGQSGLELVFRNGLPLNTVAKMN